MKNPMFRKVLSTLVLMLLFSVISASRLTAQTGGGTPNQAEIDRIISRFTRKESEFRRALNSYSFKRDAIIQSIGMGGQVIGEYHRVSQFTFDDQGNRYEKINFFPMSSMPEITPEDIEDLGAWNHLRSSLRKLTIHHQICR
jgi:hypothetical protein